MNSDKYVSRAGDKLAGAAAKLGLDFKDKVVLDVGSSTGGFTQYSLSRGAAKVVAVDVGTNQLHSSLRLDPRVELHEKTDIRDFKSDEKPDIILIDVSFISLRQILPHIAKLAAKDTRIIALLKPQFEARPDELNRGVVKNDSIRRQIIKDFENWIKNYFVTKAKTDSQISGMSGNVERFYLLCRF
jgi:23S rRNA (cytidine1920-2'-O)/16S rRNA (cytidine1409-2'-O)-methyltransferase